MPRLVAAVALSAILAACTTEPVSGRPDDALPLPAAVGHGPTPEAARVDACRALARELAGVVGPAWPDWWSYVGTMRREGFPTAVAAELLNLDRFEAAADELGVGVQALPALKGRHRARATLDGRRLLAAYDAEIARADQALARLQAERPLWSDQSWAGIERLMNDIRAGREHLARSRDRVRAWLSIP